MLEKPNATLPGTVRRVMQFPTGLKSGDCDRWSGTLARTRIEKSLTDSSGQRVQLKTKAKVNITIKAEPVPL